MRNRITSSAMASFFVARAEAQKAGSSHPALCADEPVYRVTGDEQESSNTISPLMAGFPHPSSGAGAFQPKRGWLFQAQQ